MRCDLVLLTTHRRPTKSPRLDCGCHAESFKRVLLLIVPQLLELRLGFATDAKFISTSSASSASSVQIDRVALVHRFYAVGQLSTLAAFPQRDRERFYRPSACPNSDAVPASPTPTATYAPEICGHAAYVPFDASAS